MPCKQILLSTVAHPLRPTRMMVSDCPAKFTDEIDSTSPTKIPGLRYFPFRHQRMAFAETKNVNISSSRWRKLLHSALTASALEKKIAMDSVVMITWTWACLACL